jgi:hypothetical protein
MKLNIIIPSTRAGEGLKPSLLTSDAIEITIAVREISRSGESSAH